MNVKHKTERDHIISEVLSRLSSFENDDFTKNRDFTNNHDILNDINAYVNILMKMFSVFKERLIQKYKTNNERASLYEMLTEIFSMQTTRQKIVDVTRKSSQKVTHEKLKFERWNNLIYYLNRFTSKVRLCIFKSLIRQFFRIIHDDFMHVDFHWVFATIFETIYIRRLVHRFKQYIVYCSNYLLN